MKPKLRFKEFSDEYVLSDLGKYLIQYKKTTNSNNQYPVLTSSRSGIFFQEDYFNRQVASKDNTGYNIVPRNYFTYRHMSDDTIFSFNINTLCDYGIVSTLYPVFTTNTEMNSNYLKEYLNNSKRFSEYCLLQKQGGSRTYMYFDKLKKFVGCFPSIQEQTKVSNFLSLIDKKIDLQSKKIEDLKLFKKGLIETEFTNSNYNEINLKNILKERKLYSEKGLEYPHVTLSKDGIYDKGERYNRDFLVKSEDKKYKITYLNDLCYNPANLKFGVICLNEYGSAIFSPIYVTFEINSIANPKYIKYYTMRNNFINAIRKYEQGTVYERMAVAPEDFLKFNIKLPNIETQNKIVLKLSKLDKKLQLEENKLSKLTALKKGLMQSMFV